MYLTRRLLQLSLMIMLTACCGKRNFAPVTEIATIEPMPRSGLHVVKRKETLYDIAWRYGLDYRDLAGYNDLDDPTNIHLGQKLKLHNGRIDTKKHVASRSAKHQKIKWDEINNNKVSVWYWPARGDITKKFSKLHKGINIAGRLGQAVNATADGIVVYSGDGLKGYGNLIIIKHNSTYLSAYAHNHQNLVEEGDRVRRGQKIAEMGMYGHNKALLHFEIRKAGQPIDPLTRLKFY